MVVLSVTTYSQKSDIAFVGVTGGIGLSNNKIALANLEVGMVDNLGIGVNVGYLVHMTDLSHIPHVFYAMGNYSVALGFFHSLSVNVGGSYHNYSLYHKDKRGWEMIYRLSYDYMLTPKFSKLHGDSFNRPGAYLTVGVGYTKNLTFATFGLKTTF
jgi:hypothetical protein